MAAVKQQFAVRGSEGLFIYDDISESPKQILFEQRTNPIGHRFMLFSPCGKFLAFCDGEKTVILDANNWTPRLTLPELPATTSMFFSPKSTYFCTWHPFKGAVTQPKPAPASEGESQDGNLAQATNAIVSKANLKIYNTQTMELAAEFIEKNQKYWHPVWTDDEALFGRLVGSELLLHENNNFGKYTKKYVVPKLAGFSIGSGASPYHFAAYVPAGNQPAAVRVYRYPDIQGAIAAKTFFKADSVSMSWNKRGNALIVMALTEVDSTGKSYYGETHLYLVLTNGESFQLPMAKPGPVYSVDWNPSSTEFCVVYGFMPAKATLYNLKGEALFDFGTGPRNEVQYNPRGDIICICGFGNLRGNVEFWISSTKEGQQRKRDMIRLSHFNAEDTTLFRWSPDGRHFASATTAPRLRVNNGYKLWDASGRVIFEHKTPAEQEMWDVAWRPVPVSAFPEMPLEIGTQQNAAAGFKGAVQQKPQPAAYVPPHLRGVSNRPAFKLHDDEELPSNVKNDQDGNMSKNKKKAGNRQGGANAQATASATKALEIVNADAELQKKKKNLLKKLEQIAVLKQKQANGEQLELNQVEKIEKEGELLKEFQELQVD